MIDKSVPVVVESGASGSHSFAVERGINGQDQKIISVKEAQTFVYGLLRRYEISFEKVIFVRPIKMMAHEFDDSALPQQCKIEPANNGKCYVIISESLLSDVKESCEGFLRASGTPNNWQLSTAYNLLLEIAHYKYLHWSINRCKRWALNEVFSVTY